MDDNWSLDILDLNDYGPENNRGHRLILVVIDNFNKFGWTDPIKNNKAQAIKNSFRNILISSRRKPNLVETEQGNEFYDNTFQKFVYIIKIKHCSRNTSMGAVFVKDFNRIIRDLFKRPVFERGDAVWVVVLPILTKQNNTRTHTSTKLTSIQASLKNNEGFFHKKILDKWKRVTPKIQVNHLVRVGDLRKAFSKGDTTNWFNKLYQITEIIKDTVPSYHIDNLAERYNESLLKKTEISMKENEDVMKALNLK